MKKTIKNALAEFNRHEHKYIYWVEYIGGVDTDYIVHGVAGPRRYLYYGWREAVRLYNAYAKDSAPRCY